MRLFRILSFNIILSILAVALVVSILKLDQAWFPPLIKRMKMLSLPFFVFGAFLVIYAAITLHNHSGATGAPGDPTRQLVTVGLFKWMRNPIYAGDILLLFGVALYTRSRLLLLLAILSIPIIHSIVYFIEEPKTEKRFGDEYREYKHKVPRWFPRLSPPPRYRKS